MLLIDIKDRNLVIERIKLILTCFIFFSIPITKLVTQVNIAGFILIAILLYEVDYKTHLKKLYNNNLFWPFFIYLILYPISLLWSDNIKWGEFITERHLWFLFFPVLLLSTQKKYINYYILSFLLGASFTEILSYLTWFKVINPLYAFYASDRDPTVFNPHTVYNFVLAWAIFLITNQILFNKTNIYLKTIGVVFLITMTTNMFITGGRGGQVTFFAIALFLLIRFFYSKKLLIKGSLISLITITSIFTFYYKTSNIFNNRVNKAFNEIKNFSPTSHGSVTDRIFMYHNTINMILKRPFLESIIGVGAGSFPEEYNKYVDPKRYTFYLKPGPDNHFHPHNQILYELGAYGILGLMTLLWIIFRITKIALTINDQYSTIRIGFLLFSIIMFLPDTLLLSYSTAMLFITFSVILFGLYDNNQPNESNS